MGNRANIKLRFSSSEDETDDGFNFIPERDFIYLYTHDGGVEHTVTRLWAALGRRERWKDESYLARIIIFTFLAGDLECTNTMGIGPLLEDNEEGNRIVEVDLMYQKVVIGPFSWTFQAFIDTPLALLIDAAQERV